MAGDNIVTFTTSKTGTFTYTRWMGMLSGTITVVEPDNAEIGATPGTETPYAGGGCSMIGGASSSGSLSGGCCGGREKRERSNIAKNRRTLKQSFLKFGD